MKHPYARTDYVRGESDILKWHSHAETYPVLDTEGFDSFVKDIEARGIHEAVKYRIVNDEKEYLDGRNRVAACRVLHIPWPEECVEVADDQVEAYIDSLNLHRRHLTKGQRQARVEALRAKGDSLRQIASTLGVHPATVARDVSEFESKAADSTVANATVETVVGRDGKRRKARTAARRTGKPCPKKKPKRLLCARCQRVGAVKDCPGCAEARRPTKAREPGDDTEEEQAAEEWKDAEGELIPAKATIAFERAKHLVAICREMNGIVRRVEELAKGPGGRLVKFAGIFRPKMDEAKGHLWANRATHVCPYCHGKKDSCEHCKGEGWTAKHVWEQAPGNNAKAKR
ncbi:MAG TPA: helix-turn-helix domain-containing protein [Gemmataceae bacterium]|nr:helix-turn-helix domain-containing protein [Gemmataceae bacterium]